MTTNLETNTQGAAQDQYDIDDEGMSLLDMLLVVLAHKKLIIYVTLSAAVVSLIVSLLLPKTYEATVRLMPTKNGSSSSAAMLSQFSGLVGMAGMAGMDIGGGTPADLYMSMLKGDTIADAIINRFDLMSTLDIEYRVAARSKLQEFFKATKDKKSDVISITVRRKDPEKAASMANAFAEELQGLLKKLAITETTQRRQFFEAQLKDSYIALSQAEDELKGFQESTGAFKIDDQATAVLEGMARLQAQIAAKEIEIRVRKMYSTEHNRDYKRAEEELNGLKDEFRKLEAQEGGQRTNNLITTQQIPALGTQYLRKLREFKFQETLYEILIKQYEMARLEEAQDAPIIQIIDVATPPDYKSSPKRASIVILWTFMAFFLSVLIAFIREAIEKSSLDPESGEKIQLIKSHLMFWKMGKGNPTMSSSTAETPNTDLDPSEKSA